MARVGHRESVRAEMTPRQEIDGGYIEYVSPVWQDDVRASGYRFTCSECGWQSPVMKWRPGAQAQADNHECSDA